MRRSASGTVHSMEQKYDDHATEVDGDTSLRDTVAAIPAM